MYIPCNAFALDSPKDKYTNVIKPGHINPDLTRYELHRVWEVEATLKPRHRHVYRLRELHLLPKRPAQKIHSPHQSPSQ